MTPTEVHDTLRKMDANGTGYLTFELFKKALIDPEDPENDPLISGDKAAAAGGGGIGDGLDDDEDFERIVIAPKRIRELNEAEDAGEEKEVNVVVLKHIRFQVIPARKFYKVWDSRKTKALAKFSVWEPETESSWISKLARPREIISLGFVKHCLLLLAAFIIN